MEKGHSCVHADFQRKELKKKSGKKKLTNAVGKLHQELGFF